MDILRYVSCGAFFTDSNHVIFNNRSLIVKTDTLMDYVGMAIVSNRKEMLRTPEMYNLMKFIDTDETQNMIKDKSIGSQKKFVKLLDTYKEQCVFTKSDDDSIFIKFYKDNGFGIDNKINYEMQLDEGNIIAADKSSTGMSAGYLNHFFDYAKELKYGSNVMLLRLSENEKYIRHTYEIMGYRYEVIDKGSIFDADFISEKILSAMDKNAKERFFSGTTCDEYDLDNFNDSFGNVQHFIKNNEIYGPLSMYLDNERKKYEQGTCNTDERDKITRNPIFDCISSVLIKIKKK